MEMFHQYFRYIPSDLRRDVLNDGFTRFNHDALSNLSYRIKNKKIVFKYNDEQKNLEDDISGYSFRLPTSSYEMCEIGTALHNCAASYASSVENGGCTIVYAQKDGEYKKIKVDSRSSVYKNPRLYEEFKISDLYFELFPKFR